MATTTMVRVAVPAYTTDHKHRLEQAQTKRQALDREEAGVPCMSTIGNGCGKSCAAGKLVLAFALLSRKGQRTTTTQGNALPCECRACSDACPSGCWQKSFGVAKRLLAF